MSDIIISLHQQGLSETVRTAIIGVAAIVAVFFSFWYGKKLGLSNKKIAIFLIIAYPIDFILQELARCGTIWAAQMHILGIQTVVNVQAKTFVVIPFVALLAAKIINTPWKVTADLLAIANLLNYAICCIGCVFTGCCVGYPCSLGWYSPLTGKVVFQTQLLNTGIMLLIVSFLLFRARYHRYVADGKQFPLVLILFGATRFLTEFLMDNEKLALGMSIVSFHCIVMVLAGAVALLVIRKYRKSRLRF